MIVNDGSIPKKVRFDIPLGTTTPTTSRNRTIAFHCIKEGDYIEHDHLIYNLNICSIINSIST